jgi:hypothetical protein
MKLTGPRLAITLGIALLAQAGVFAWTYQDLLYFRQPLGAVTKTEAETFERNAVEALNRPDITLRHLETIADAAKAFKSPAVELRALERAVKANPADGRMTLKLADALRRSGQLQRAEALYRSVLIVEKGGAQ